METASGICKSDLVLKARNGLNLTGVKKVKSTEPGRVVAQLDGCVIVVTGANLSVETLNIATGILDITGLIITINYTGHKEKRFSFKGIFK